MIAPCGRYEDFCLLLTLEGVDPFVAISRVEECRGRIALKSVSAVESGEYINDYENEERPATLGTQRLMSKLRDLVPCLVHDTSCRGRKPSKHISYSHRLMGTRAGSLMVIPVHPGKEAEVGAEYGVL